MTVTNKDLLDQMKKLEELLVPKKKGEYIGQGDIAVPDEIKIEYHSTYGGDGLGIVFNDGKQTLYYMKHHGGIYNVNFAGMDGEKEHFLVQCKLVETKWEDLKPGDTIWTGSMAITFDRSCLGDYYKVLPNKKLVWVSDMSETFIYDYFEDQEVYKLIKID